MPPKNSFIITDFTNPIIYLYDSPSAWLTVEERFNNVDFERYAWWPFNADYLIVPETKKLVGFSYFLLNDCRSLVEELIDISSPKLINFVSDINSDGAERYLNSEAKRSLESGVQYLELLLGDPSGAQYHAMQMVYPTWRLDKQTQQYASVSHNALAKELDDYGLTLPDELLFPVQVID